MVFVAGEDVRGCKAPHKGAAEKLTSLEIVEGQLVSNGGRGFTLTLPGLFVVLCCVCSVHVVGV